MPKVSIKVNESGMGEVLLDGALIPNVVAVGFNSDAGTPTELTLVMAPVEIELDARIEIERVFAARRQA